MTTSLLLCQTRYVNGYDLQVLRDYALEAPWNWRVLFETLLEEVEHARRQEDYEERTEELEALVNETRKKLDSISAELHALLPNDVDGANTPWITKAVINGSVKTLRERLTSLQEQLDSVVEDLDLNAAPAAATTAAAPAVPPAAPPGAKP